MTKNFEILLPQSSKETQNIDLYSRYRKINYLLKSLQTYSVIQAPPNADTIFRIAHL